MTQDQTVSNSASNQPVNAWLEALGSAAPAPGGGAAAAMSSAMAAALVEMVCNLTIGKAAFAEYEAQATEIRDAARDLRLAALRQIDADAAAFTDLMAAYRLPRETGEQKARRRAVIETATLRAADVPLDIAATAGSVAGLAAQLPGRSNRSVLSDVGVAASAAAAAIDSAVINVEVNLASLPDGPPRTERAGKLPGLLERAGQARELSAEVRREISQ
jgi:methenyltetrahydrofolate cyclohydrolase